MIEIISGVPFYVWPLLASLLIGGWKSRTTHTISWKTLLIMPAAMILWSIYATTALYRTLAICLWVISISLGIWFGSLTIRHLSLRFDKQKKLIEVSGSWTPMILSLSIFLLRYFLGATYGLHPELKGNLALFAVENIATVVSGMFAGRLLGYWQRSKESSHTDLIEAAK
jgi:hypothetical protein